MKLTAKMMVLVTGLCLFGCAIDAEADGESASLGELSQPQKVKTDRTGDFCHFFLCDSGLARNGTCVDADCTDCKAADGRHGPEEGNEVCGAGPAPFKARWSTRASSSSGGVIAAP